jgi:hypothetical protein
MASHRSQAHAISWDSRASGRLLPDMDERGSAVISPWFSGQRASA